MKTILEPTDPRLYRVKFENASEDIRAYNPLQAFAIFMGEAAANLPIEISGGFSNQIIIYVQGGYDPTLIEDITEDVDNADNYIWCGPDSLKRFNKKEKRKKRRGNK